MLVSTALPCNRVISLYVGPEPGASPRAAAMVHRYRWLPLLPLLLLLVHPHVAGAVDETALAPAVQTPLYKDPTAPIPARVADLLGRMTVQEKVAQLLELWGGANVFEKLLKVYNGSSVGAVMIGGGAPNVTCQNAPTCRIAVQNELQRNMVERSRLGIPITFTQETMTSGMHNGTSFPHPVAQGSSWNTSLVHEIAKAVAEEAWHSGVDRGYSPVLQVVTDPRFGRWHENFGGDGLLVAAYAKAAVEGLQGDGGSGPNSYLMPGHIVAEAKHFGGYGGSHKDGAPVETGVGALHDIYLRPWKAAAKAGLRALMASHNDINGRPCHSNPYLLTKIMREDFGFGDGLIASDGHDVNRVYYTGTCTDAVDAATQCLSAGVDQDLGGMSYGPRCDPRNTTIYGCGAAVTEGGTCPSCPIDPYGEENANSSILLNGISAGRVSMNDINRAAGNVLRAKFAARLFDDAKYRDPALIHQFMHNPRHRQLARSAAQEGSVLLKNAAPPLPHPRSNCSDGSFFSGMDWGGDNNQSYSKVRTIDECCKACAATTWCNHFSLAFSSMDCYLKGGHRTLVVNSGSTAGYCTKGPAPPPAPPPGPLLPLDKNKVKKIAVLGPNAAAAGDQLGQYECTNDQSKVVTVEQGIRTVAGVEVTYSVGADWHSPPSPTMIDEAVAAANASDVAVLVLGDDTSTCGEARDRDDLDLPGSQLDLLYAVSSRTDTPVVVVLISCRPATFGSGGQSKFGPTPNTLLDGVQALLVAWNCGSEGGNAVADLLFGEVSPSGRLAANWLNSAGSAGATSSTWGLARQQSDYDRTLEEGDPVAFVFGFGLDYLQVQRGVPSLSAGNISAVGETTLTVAIHNSATMAGGYAVQVYFRQRVSRVARPNLLLANFTKVWLPAKGSAVASVTVKAEELGYFDAWEGRQRVDTGEVHGVYDLLVCADSTCGCGDTSRNSVPGCLAQQPHATLHIHD